MQINITESWVSLQLIKHFLNYWNGTFSRYYNLVQFTIVHAKTQRPCFFLSSKTRCLSIILGTCSIRVTKPLMQFSTDTLWVISINILSVSDSGSSTKHRHSSAKISARKTPSWQRSNHQTQWRAAPPLQQGLYESSLYKNTAPSEKDNQQGLPRWTQEFPTDAVMLWAAKVVAQANQPQTRSWRNQRWRRGRGGCASRFQHLNEFCLQPAPSTEAWSMPPACQTQQSEHGSACAN